MNRRVVVTGVGVVSPIGISAKAFWENLLAGKVGIRRIQQFDPGGFACQIAGEVPEYKIGDFVPKSYRKATKVMARDIELAVIAADDAIKDAGLKTKAYTDKPEINPARFGCNIGAGLINAELDELTSAMHIAREGNKLDLHKWGRDGMTQLTPLWLLKYLPNMLACHVTIIHELKGPSNTITCADASSHLAIGEAFRTIQRGNADLAICGGAESKVNPMGMIRHQMLHRLNETHNDSPETALRPFDADAAGMAHGEGGGLLILEEYEHAKSRGAKIYAELVGFGASQDTYSITEPDPSGHSYGKAIGKALADANLPPAAVDLVIPCGLGIPSHDKAELNGLTQVFVPVYRFEPQLEACSYYLVAEALANAAKYSGATAAAVSVAAAGDVVTVDVSDDGCGGACPTAGGGLEGLAERVSALGGTLMIESPPGGGTRLRAEIPVPLHVS